MEIKHSLSTKARRKANDNSPTFGDDFQRAAEIPFAKHAGNWWIFLPLMAKGNCCFSSSSANCFLRLLQVKQIHFALNSLLNVHFNTQQTPTLQAPFWTSQLMWLWLSLHNNNKWLICHQRARKQWHEKTPNLPHMKQRKQGNQESSPLKPLIFMTLGLVVFLFYSFFPFHWTLLFVTVFI